MLAPRGILGVALLVASMGAALAQDAQPVGRVQLSTTSVGLLLGYDQGQGRLSFQGKEYPFTLSGFKVATLGFTQMDALGQVYDLQEVADFAGRYVVVAQAFTLVQGGGNTLLRNEKGVTLYLQNLQHGVELTLGGGSLTIALAEPDVAASQTTTDAAPVQDQIGHADR